MHSLQLLEYQLQILRTDMDDIKYRAWLVVFAAWLCRFIEGGLMKSFGVLLITVTEQCEILVWKYGNTIALMHIFGSFVSKCYVYFVCLFVCISMYCYD